jgi:predicted nucleotidyltransferase
MSQASLSQLEQKTDLPAPHAAFLQDALPRLQADERIVAVAAGGSFLTGSMDEYSDLDLVIAVSPAGIPQIMQERHQIASTLGPLLAAFTGEHVGEPRLLICLYGPPLLHVDLKFIALTDAVHRVEDPLILWERDGQFSEVLKRSEAAYPTPDLQWIEDRFWVWVHYGAAKIGRGEIMEAHDSLAFMRLFVLGPLALFAQGARPAGVRHVETQAQPYLADLIRTTASYERLACVTALHATATLYRRLRTQLATTTFAPRPEAEAAAMDYLAQIERHITETEKVSSSGASTPRQ